MKDKGVYKVFNNKAKEEVKTPWLFLMMNNGDIKIMDNVKIGRLPLTEPDGTEKWVDINPLKLRRLVWGDGRIDCYIGYEDEAELYPHEPKHHAKIFRDIVVALQLNKGNLQEGGKFNAKWLLIAGIIVVVLGIGYFVFTKDSGTTTQIVNETINQTINTTINTTIKTATPVKTIEVN